MRSFELDKYINNPELVNEKISELIKNNLLKIQKYNIEEIEGHILKAEHNLIFVKDNIQLNHLDWAITGCYYASYHAALALIMTKNYISKNHLATLFILIKEFYNKDLTKEDIKNFADLLDYQDILFYVESKNKREDATYSTKILYSKQEVEQLRMKATLFVSKIKELIQNKISIN